MEEQERAKVEFPVMEFRVVKFSRFNSTEEPYYAIQYSRPGDKKYKYWTTLQECLKSEETRNDNLWNRPLLFNNVNDALIRMEELEKWHNQGMGSDPDDYEAEIVVTKTLEKAVLA